MHRITVAEASGSPAFGCELSVTGDVAVVELRGEADVAIVDRLRDVFADALGTTCSTITVDASQLTFCDASTMRCLVEAADRATLTGTRFTVRGTSAPVRLVVALCDLEQHLSVESPAWRGTPA